MRKKLLALLLAAIMIFSLLPVTALAEGFTPSTLNPLDIGIGGDQSGGVDAPPAATHGLSVTKEGGATEGIDEDYYWDNDALHIRASGLTVSGTTAKESIVVDEDVSALTLNGVKFEPTDEVGYNNKYPITSNSEALTITLAGDNQIGKAVEYMDETQYDEYVVEEGITGKDLIFTGNGNLLIYDQQKGIKANNVTFDKAFSGTVKIEDFGKNEKCAINAESYWDESKQSYVGGDVSLLGGTFDLKSYASKGITANGNVTINNANLTIDSCSDGIEASGILVSDSLAFGNVEITSCLNVSITSKEDEPIDAGGTLTIKDCPDFDVVAEDDDALRSGGDLIIDNSTVDVTADADGLDTEAGAIIKGGSNVTVHADDEGIICTTLTVDGANTVIYAVGDCDNTDDGYGILFEDKEGKDNVLTVTGGTVKITGSTAISIESDKTLTQNLPAGIALMANTVKDTFTYLQEVTFKTVVPDPEFTDEKYKMSFIGDDIAKSVMLESITHDLEVKKLNTDGITLIDAVESEDYSWDGNELVIPDNGLTVTGTTKKEHILVASNVTELTLKDVKIIPTAEIENGILIEEGALSTTDVDGICKITLVGENQIGNAVTYTENTKDFDYKVKTGIESSGSITFTGSGDLTVYDQIGGIKAANVTFDESFAGTVKIEDFGHENCAINARGVYDEEQGKTVGGDVKLLGGTFNLTSYKSNGIYAQGAVNVNNAKLTVSSYYDAIEAGGDVTFTDCTEVKLTSAYGIGIDSNNNVTVTNCKLSVTSDGDAIEAKVVTLTNCDEVTLTSTDDCGIDSNDSVTVTDCGNISITSDSDCIYDASETLLIKNCNKVALKSAESCIDDVDGTVTIENCPKVEIETDDYCFDCGGVKVTIKGCPDVQIKSTDARAIQAGDLLIENSTVVIDAPDNDGLYISPDVSKGALGSLTVKNSSFTVKAKYTGIICWNLTVEGAKSMVYACGNSGNEGTDYSGLKINGEEPALAVTGGVVKLTGGKAAINIEKPDNFMMSLPEGVTLKGNTAKDTFTDLQEVTFNEVVPDPASPDKKITVSCIGDTVALSAMVEASVDDCEYTKTVSLTEGSFGMKLGGKDAGWFKFEAVDGGWKIMKTSAPGMVGVLRYPYLAMKDGKLTYTDKDNATVWTYKNGAFNTSVKTEQKSDGYWFLFWYIPGRGSKTVTTTYYLSTVTNGDKLSTCCTCAELYTIASGTHDFGCWIDCKDGKQHMHVCKNCGEVEYEDHHYGEDNKCKECGAYDSSKAKVEISVKVTEKTSKHFVGFLFWGTWKNVTTYTATIKTEADGVKVTKVQYQLNGSSKWITGTSVCSDKPIESLKVKAWDNKGNVYEYEYPEAPAATFTVSFEPVKDGDVETGEVHDAGGQKVTEITVPSGAEISVNGSTITIGETAFTAVANSGWTFSSFNPSSGTITADTTIKVNFAQNQPD